MLEWAAAVSIRCSSFLLRLSYIFSVPLGRRSKTSLIFSFYHKLWAYLIPRCIQSRRDILKRGPWGVFSNQVYLLYALRGTVCDFFRFRAVHPPQIGWKSLSISASFSPLVLRFRGPTNVRVSPSLHLWLPSHCGLSFGSACVKSYPHRPNTAQPRCWQGRDE